MDFSPRHSIALDASPTLDSREFAAWIAAGLGAGGRLASMFGAPLATGGVGLVAILAKEREGVFAAARTGPVAAWPSLTRAFAQAHLFEREIYEQWGIVPEGHPWLKPVRFHAPGGGGARPRPGETEYFRVDGPDTHEVAVGPVHAGVIEPGHFRFQCLGENVMHLEISLGYQHRGVERALVGGPNPRAIHLMQTLAGDTSVGHAWAYCALLETMAEAEAPRRGVQIRRIGLELERLANHTGDLGALAGDVGFLPTLSYCGRLRGDFLNMTALVCGNRFGRGLVCPGGVAYDLDAALAAELQRRLGLARLEVKGALDLLFNAPSVLNRFENTGVVSAKTGLDLGLVGPPARACGLARDSRRHFPLPGCDPEDIPLRLAESGDVHARALVRRLEIEASFDFLDAALSALPRGEVSVGLGPLPAGRLAASLVEGWRGEVCHVALTDAAGRFSVYKVTDPSFHNWMGLAMALREEEISDFPLCNKSFNLSYCGHDL